MTARYRGHKSRQELPPGGGGEIKENLNNANLSTAIVRNDIQLAAKTIIDSTKIINAALLDKKIYDKKYPIINNCTSIRETA